MRTLTFLVDFDRVQRAGEEGALMTRLAVAVNTMMSCEYVFKTLEELRSDPRQKSLTIGIGQYLIAIQTGHLHEGLLLIDNPNDPALTVSKATGLKRFIDRLSPESAQDYRTILHLLTDPTERVNFSRYVEGFRNMVAFHVDVGYRGRRPRGIPVTTQALERLAKRKRMGAWNRRDHKTGERDERRFEFADMVVDTAVCRYVWGIPESVTGTAMRAEADRILVLIQDYAKAYVGFASELCMKYFSEKVM